VSHPAPRELPLRAVHEASGAQFEVSHGWNLPKAYERGPGAEYDALRNTAAITERTHYSRLLVTGSDAVDVLDAVLFGHVRELEEDRSMGTFCTDAEGHVSDLVMLNRTGGIAYLVEGEPSRGPATEALLRAAVQADYDVRIDDRTSTTCALEIVGPEAEKAVAAYVSPDLPPYLRPGHLVSFEFHGFRSSVRRAAGESPSYLFMMAPQVASHLWESATAGGLVAAGTEAVETLRIEDGVPSWAAEFSSGLTPEEANLVAGTAGRTLVSLSIQGPEPVRRGADVIAEGAEIGYVTSSSPSRRLDGTAALAVIGSSFTTAGVRLSVAGRDATTDLRHRSP